MSTAGLSDDDDLSVGQTKTDRTEKSNYWKRMLKRYEKRNALLERKQAALVERVRFMECALPSLMMGAVAGVKCEPQVTSRDMSSCSHSTSKQSSTRSSSSHACPKRSSTRFGKAEEVGIKIEDIRRCRMHYDN